MAPANITVKSRSGATIATLRVDPSVRSVEGGWVGGGGTEATSARARRWMGAAPLPPRRSWHTQF